MATKKRKQRAASPSRARRAFADDPPSARAEPELESDANADGESDEASEPELIDDAELFDDPSAAAAGDGADSPSTFMRIRPSRGQAGPLARYDPLEAYMRDVQRYKLLTPEEERDAAVKYYEEGDLDAAARLVTANLRLVVKIAYEYRRAHRHLPDLIQEGSIGLMQAVKKFDPYKGVKLSTYAAWWIRAYMLRFILNNARLVKLGTTQAQRKLFFNLRKEKARLSAMGIEPTPETIAKALDVSADEVVSMDRRLSSGEMSLDAPSRAHDEASQSRVELLPASAPSTDDVLADSEVHELLRERLVEFGKTLSGKDARIFEARMLTEDPLTLQDLGNEFGVSRERVRQLEKRLQLRLKDYLAEQLGEGALTG